MPAIDSGLETLAAALKKDKTSVVFMVGAGISTSCGIPDFRSPETGLYSNLQKLNLPYAEAVFDIDYFRKNPNAFYTLAGELYPGKFKPSPFHYFIRLLQDKNKLKRVFTQNIDTLERIAGVKDEFVVEAHGSFANNHCIDCSEEMSVDELKKQMDTGIPKCSKCKGYVKPDIVFFGEQLPSKFFNCWDDDFDDGFDIAIVAGTGLAVYPFASLADETPSKTLRVLINREKCGSFEHSPRKSDINLLGFCDDTILKLCDFCGWKEELEALISQGKKEENAEDEAKSEEEIEAAILKGTAEESKHLAAEIADAEKEVPAEKPSADDDENKEKKSDGKEVDDLAEGLEGVHIKE